MNDMAAPRQAQDWSKPCFFRCSTYWPTLGSGRTSVLFKQYASHPAPVCVRMTGVESDDVIRRLQSKGLNARREAGICGVVCLVAKTS